MRREAERVLVLGTTRFGKSYWVKRQLDKLPASSTLVIWDPNGEYAGPHARDGLIGCSTFQGFEAARAALSKAALPRVAIQCGREAHAEFARVCDLVFAGGGCTFVVDEAHDYCRTGRCPPELLNLVRKTTHRQVDLWVIAQRPYAIAVDMRDQMDRKTVLFGMRGKRSLEWCDEERAQGLGELVIRLQPREFVVWPGPGGNVKPAQLMKRPRPSICTAMD